ncbi:P-loop containing nucleoside triphosphate hydrolase protein [Geopyxis carbonaria]|nr:P-loop containing nucleoside triphosphate hydrolase protein [Geopyxis carbonaria]
MPRPPLISLRSATFQHTPTSRPLFANTTFTLPSPPSPEKWTVLGPSKSTFLSILRGSLLASPPNSRLYPALAAHGKWPQSAIQSVTFGGGGGGGMLKGAIGGDGYVSARYESLREEFDVTLREWLGGGEQVDVRLLRELGLEGVLERRVMGLSNGQSRRARLAQALGRRPEVVVVDEPFMGLDPPGKVMLSQLLSRISSESTPVVLGLRRQDPVPQWVTHLAYVEDDRLVSSGPKAAVAAAVRQELGHELHLTPSASAPKGVVEKAWSGIGTLTPPPSPPSSSSSSSSAIAPAEPLVEITSATLSYGPTPILRNFTWTIRRGEKWGLFGPNGSGKTTLTSLLTSDHPLTYALPIKHFGRERLPKVGVPGVSVFEIQARIGIAAPEVHAFFPAHLSLRRCVESGYAETPLSPPRLTAAQRTHLDAVLASFTDLLPAGGEGWGETFGGADMSTQRLSLFLRATAPKRDLLVLDEAFSGMRAEVRERCFAFLQSEQGWEEGRQAMVVVSHESEEVPAGVEKFVKLPEWGCGEGVVFGRL